MRHVCLSLLRVLCANKLVSSEVCLPETLVCCVLSLHKPSKSLVLIGMVIPAFSISPTSIFHITVASHPTIIPDLTATSNSVLVTQAECISDEDDNESSSAIFESSLIVGRQSSSSIMNSLAVQSSTGNASTVKKWEA